MHHRNAPVILPAHVRELLWEYRVGAVSWPEHSPLIVRKILEVGGWDSIRWLRGIGGDAMLREWLRSHRGGGLDPRKLRFWQLVLELPKKSVDGWIERSLMNPWNTRWHG